MKRPYIYVASSWRNEQRQQATVRALRDWGADVYDFREPANNAGGFHWSEIGQDWREWSPETLIQALDHPIARMGFRADMNALQACDLCVLVMPCGRSAHLELGYAIGAGKPTAILLDDGEPELMYAMVDFLTPELSVLCTWAQGVWGISLGLEGRSDDSPTDAVRTSGKVRR